MLNTHKEVKIFPLVTIGIPVFNGDKSLSKAINSALNQSYENIEIIISDNCSTDNTEEICKSFGNPKISYIRQKENIGPTRNFEYLLKVSKGEFFMWLGHDDYIERDYIKICCAFLIKNPDYSICGGKAKYFTEKNLSHFGKNYSIEINNPEKRLINYYRIVTENGIFYGVIRKNLLAYINIKNKLAGDWIFVGRLAFYGKIKTSEETFILRQLGNTSASYRKIAGSMGLSAFNIYLPWFAIPCNLAEEIFFDEPFRNFSLKRKIYLSIKIFFITLKKQVSGHLRFFINRMVKLILGKNLFNRLKTFIKNNSPNHYP